MHRRTVVDDTSTFHDTSDMVVCSKCNEYFEIHNATHHDPLCTVLCIHCCTLPADNHIKLDKRKSFRKIGGKKQTRWN